MVTPTVRLARMLGQGGMGSVWVADHLALRTQVAVKFMSAALAQNGPAVARFTREATAAASVKSPHIVQVFDHGFTSPDRIPFIVMELLDGQDLRHLIERDGAVPLELLTKIVAQAGRGLAKAHAAGIVHRDIKPDNLFLLDVEGEPFVKVLDFGVAKQTESDGGFAMTSTGATVGTPYYMSPEQMLSAKGVDARSDLWSLAVVAYHAITGRVPFDAETMGALCIAIDRASFAPPSQVRPGLSPAIDAWFARAMARQPEARFPTAREMTDAFEAATRGIEPMRTSAASMPAASSPAMPGATPPPTFDGTAVTQPGKPRSNAGLMAATAVIALGVLVVGGVFALRPRPVAQESGSPAGAAEPPAATSSLLPPSPSPSTVPVAVASASSPIPMTPPSAVAPKGKTPAGPAAKAAPPTVAQPPTPPPATPPAKPPTPAGPDRGF